MKRFLSRTAKQFRHSARRAGVFFLSLLTVFYSFGGLDLYLGLTTPFAPMQAGAAYTGKQIHTVEYILGGGSDNTVRGDNILAYAGSSWNTVKATAGTKSVVLEGTNIQVKNAYLDVSFGISASVAVSNIAVFTDVAGSTAAGSDVRVAEELDTNSYSGTGLTGYIRSVHDVTALFQTQSDTLWHSGVSVSTGVQVDFSAASNRTLTSVKLVITYEDDFSASAHSEVKTVRFPLDSTNGTDTGTRQAACAAAATCGFTYTADIPDAAADSDILSVHFELRGVVDSATASTFQPQIVGGTAGPAYAWSETNADNTNVSVYYVPTVGPPNFTRNSLQTLNIINGSVALGALGGELVVTYRYSTGAPRQTETVRYYVDQDTTNPGTVKSLFATITPAVSNSAFTVSNLWYRVRMPAIAATNFSVFSQVGTSTSVTKTYVLTGTNARAGDTPLIVHDLSANKGSFFSSQTAVGGATQSSVSNAPVGVELYITFTWDGDPTSPVTKTVQFSAAQQGVGTTLGQYNNRPAYLTLPETVTKTYRSAFLEMMYTHSRSSTVISLGTVTLGVNGSTVAITENGDTEAFHTAHYFKIASSTFSQGDTIDWTTRTLEVHETKSVSLTNYFFFSNIIVSTYDVDFSQTQQPESPKQTKTVEYDLGGGTDTTVRGDTILSYGGSTWSTTKASAGKKNIVISGSGIKVKNAYLDLHFGISGSSNINNVVVTFDADNTSSSGTDANVAEELDVNAYIGSGLSGYFRSVHDVTAFLQQQNDTQFNSGVGVVAGVGVDFSSAVNRYLTTVKLVVTYESDYSLVPHNEVKTVRFPLDSTSGTDTGSKTAACTAGAICSFNFTSDMPDAVADADILDVYVDMHMEVNSTNAADFDFQLDTMLNPSALYAWTEAVADDHAVDVHWHPVVGGNGFLRNTTQRLDIGNGTVPLNVLGGEVVVTYRYSTGAPVQTETVRYYLEQDTTSAAAVRNNFATITPIISNGGVAVKQIWYKLRLAPVAATNFTVYGRVGTSTEKSNVYAIAGTSPRTGNTPTIIYNLSADAGNFFSASTTLAGASLFSVAAGASAVGAEAYVTFTWDGSLGGTTTRSVLFSAAQQGVSPTLNQYNNRPAYLTLSEQVTKTYRSAYLATTFSHSQATSITVGTITTGVNGSTTAVTETADTTSEAYSTEYFFPIASSTFSQGNTIDWTTRTLEVNQTKSMSNVVFFTNVIAVTYDAAQEYKYPTFRQNYFRIYASSSDLIPTDPWPDGAVDVGENTEITAADFPPGNGATLRLRMSVQVATTTMLASTTSFALEYAPRLSTCGAISSWSSLGAPGSGSIWRGFNATPADGTVLSTSTPAPGQLLLSVSDRAGTYGESSPTPVNPFATAVGEDVEYDWNIQNNGAATDTPYCFRMTKADGTAFNDYSFYPTIRTAGYTAQTDTWRWYDDETNETPSIPLSGAGENVAPVDVQNENIIKLRINVREVAGSNGVGQKFKVQYSEWADFSRGVFDVVATSSCTVNSIWCYGNGVDLDDAPLTALKLTTTAALGRHNEAGTTTSTAGPLANTATEFEYTLKHAGARANAVYFFRLWDNNHNRPVALYGAASYPSLATEGALVSSTMSSIATSTVTEGVTTDVASDATSIPFGNVAIGSSGVKAAQRIVISTNATEGYQVFLKADQSMLSSYGHVIPDVTGTNATPSAWATGCASGASGCWGYHTGDDSLSGGSTRFLANDTYAQLATTTIDEIIYNPGPVTNEATDIIYRLEAHQTQVGGQYTTDLQYIVVPIF